MNSKAYKNEVETPSDRVRILPPDDALTAEMQRAWVEVDLQNLVTNAQTLLHKANGPGLLAVLKANGYGVGAVPTAHALSQLQPWGFAVATIDEAVALRNAGIDQRILILQPAQWRNRDLYCRYRLIASIDQPDLVTRWPGEFHVAVDTGMCCMGIPCSNKMIEHLDWDRAAGVFTHLHAADICPDSVQLQVQRFRECLGRLKFKSGLVRHISNSAGVWRAEQLFDVIRPGIFLYGGSPGNALPTPEPVVAVKSRITSLRSVKAGATVGYGFEHRVRDDTIIATVGIGYADGVPISLNNADVLIEGERCPMAGRVTMDMIMVDVGRCRRRPMIGQTAVILGRDGQDEINISEFAERAGTISYDILTRLSPRLPRIYSMGNSLAGRTTFTDWSRDTTTTPTYSMGMYSSSASRSSRAASETASTSFESKE